MCTAGSRRLALPDLTTRVQIANRPTTASTTPISNSSAHLQLAPTTNPMEDGAAQGRQQRHRLWCKKMVTSAAGSRFQATRVPRTLATIANRQRPTTTCRAGMAQRRDARPTPQTGSGAAEEIHLRPRRLQTMVISAAGSRRLALPDPTTHVQIANLPTTANTTPILNSSAHLQLAPTTNPTGDGAAVAPGEPDLAFCLRSS